MNYIPAAASEANSLRGQLERPFDELDRGGTNKASLYWPDGLTRRLRQGRCDGSESNDRRHSVCRFRLGGCIFFGP